MVGRACRICQRDREAILGGIALAIDGGAQAPLDCGRISYALVLLLSAEVSRCSAVA